MLQPGKGRETMVEKVELALKRSTDKPTEYDPVVDKNRKVVIVAVVVIVIDLRCVLAFLCKNLSVHPSVGRYVGQSVGHPFMS